MPDSPAAIYPAALAEHSVESLYALHGRQRPWIYWISLAGVAAGLATLPCVRVNLTVRAPGLVRPATERTELKTAVGGRIARVLARDNDRVEAGQPLVELAATDVDERLARNQALQAEKSAQVADLEAMTAWLARLEQGNAGDFATVATTVLPVATPSLARLHAQFLSQWESGRLALAKARAGNERTSALAARGLVTAQERDDASYGAAHAWAELKLVVEQTLSAWQAQLRDEETVLQQLASDGRRLRDERTLATIRAPVAGTVQGLIGLGAGAYVVAGQSLGAISPDDRLVVETIVSPKDIGLLRAGQPVRIQVDAYPYTQWGLLDGIVQSLAADVTASGQQAAFKVVVRPAALALRLPDGLSGALRKGMTVTARFVVARRSLLQILHEDASSWLDPQA